MTAFVYFNGVLMALRAVITYKGKSPFFLKKTAQKAKAKGC